MAEKTKRMPVRGCTSIPWHLIEGHDEQAKRNHDQTLERLRQRGGLDAGEAYLIIKGLSLRDHQGLDLDECKAWIKKLVESDMGERGGR